MSFFLVELSAANKDFAVAVVIEPMFGKTVQANIFMNNIGFDSGLLKDILSDN